MKVCFDLQSAIGQRTGVGNYTAHLARALLERHPPDIDLSFTYFDFKRSGHGLPIPPESEHAIRWCPGRFMQAAWKTLGIPPYDFTAGKADVYHFPNFVIPPLRRGYAVATIHDLAFLRMPETIEPKNLAYLTGRIRHTVERADAIIAVSHFTASELQNLLGTDPHKIHVIHEALGPMPPPPQADTTILQRLGLTDRPFLLTVGTVEPRKNYAFLTDVFDQLDEDIDLVIGGGLGWHVDPILQRIASSPKAKRIHHTGYLSPSELAALYIQATLFIYPTRYEGFGFPPLEAMHYGLPVLAARVPPLPEVLGEAAEWVEGWDINRWCDKISGLLHDAQRRQHLQAAGTTQTAHYSWTRAAEETLNIYRKATHT
ncbi:MAG: glycosyltransferase family 1 protein [Kiritimatiellae bacterium]|nr:glycosyltransferase family 1 protein [Kiritimatiellia bacterium]